MEQLSKLERIEALEKGILRMEERLAARLGGDRREESGSLSVAIRLEHQELAEIRSQLRELSETTHTLERVLKRMEDATQQVKETAPPAETAPAETGTLETPETPENPETATA